MSFHEANQVVLSFGTSRGEERVAKPRTFVLSRLADRILDFFKLVRTKSSGNEFPQCFLPGFLWSADFTSHKRIVSVTRKFILLGTNFRVTNNAASHEVTLLSYEMAGTAAGESELTSSQPVEAGASQRESEMNAVSFQARSLAIEATGDYWRITPKIRLSGKWLECAGFLPGHRVQVVIEQPGILTLRFVGQGKETAQ